MATETTKKRADAAFFARHSVTELSQQSDHWLNDAEFAFTAATASPLPQAYPQANPTFS